jgi:hypothetical protein
MSAAPVMAAPSYQSGAIAIAVMDATSWTVINADGSGARHITPTGGGFDSGSAVISSVAYSPDTTRVAFSTGPNHGPVTPGNVGFWVANADGSDAHKIADNEVYGSKPAWSPDGSTVYFALTTGSEGDRVVQTIEKARADGSTPPVPAYSDPGCGGGRYPQFTDHGALFFNRICTVGGYALLRPGDQTPVLSIPDDLPTVISPDGTRYAVSKQEADPADPATSVFGISFGVLGDGEVTPMTTTVPAGHYIYQLAYRPSGDVIFVDGSAVPVPGGGHTASVSVIKTVPDVANGTAHVITTVQGYVTSIDVLRGAPNFGSRPVADRIGGGDRVLTAIDASRWSYDAYGSGGRRANAAVLARSDTFADALGGTALALQYRGPLLLTPTDSLDPGVASELNRILAPGSTVFVLGGSSAISPHVEAKVKALGFTVQRLGGANRYATAVAIADRASMLAPDTVMVATGADYPDALAAGVAAGQDRNRAAVGGDPRGGVVVLTDGAAMPPDTAAYLAKLDPHKTSVYAVGGQAVKAVKAAFPGWSGAVTPLAGANRYETAAKVAASPLFGTGMPGRYTMVGVATGGNWPDALSGGALIGNQGGPLLLADGDGVPGAEAGVLTNGHLKGVAVFGGTAVVSDATLASIADTAFGSGAWDLKTDRQAPALP